MAEARKRALLIANSRFADKRLARLFAPQEDVEALRSVLSDPSVSGFDQVDVLIDQPLQPVRRAIASLCARTAPNELVLLYYTGHGILTAHNDFYLALGETTVDLPEAEGMDAAWLRSRLHRCRARRQVLILDCCHSGAFMAGRKNSMTRAVTAATFGQPEGRQGGHAGHGRYVLTASDAQSFAWDASALKEGPAGTDGRTSLFTRLLVKGLTGGAAAPDKDAVSVRDLYDYVFRNIPPEAPAMSPQIFVDLGMGEVILARNSARLRPDIVAALNDPNPYTRLGAIAELDAILRDGDAHRGPSVRRVLKERLEIEEHVQVYKRIKATLANAVPPAALILEQEDFSAVDAWCPEVVASPAGEFRAASPKDENERRDREGRSGQVWPLAETKPLPGGQRYFISYRRSAVDDQQLAHFLHDRLVAAGHESFIDIGMPVGTDWSAEIDRRIDWCDALIVLLSEGAMQSEMVHGEVRRAHHRRRPDGRPRILPVRVAYRGPLDYELDSYLGRLQYVQWQGKGDDERVLAAILSGELSAPSSLSPPESLAVDGARPQPSMNLWTLCQPPGGTLPVDDPFYVRRPADNHIEALAPQIGRTLVIKAPRQMGKSSLLSRYLAACRKQGKAISYIDFQRFSDQSLCNYFGFLAEFADELLYTLALGDVGPVSTFTQQKFIRFVQDQILARIGSPAVFAFDEVDRVLGRPWQEDFFAMLRSWHNDRAVDDKWRKMDLALVIATEPYLLIQQPLQSPFNVVPATELPAFGQADAATLNAAYGAPLAQKELAQLMDLLNGHPYLMRLAFYRLTTAGLTLPALIETAARDDGPFGDHLRAKLFALQHNPRLLPALKHLIAHRAQPDREDCWRLHGAGLVTRNELGEMQPANLLYARFFRDVQ